MMWAINNLYISIFSNYFPLSGDILDSLKCVYLHVKWVGEARRAPIPSTEQISQHSQYPW